MGEIKQREGGLWIFAPGKTDADRVLEEKQRLVELLQDPYFAEALSELKGESPELFNRKRGPKLKRGSYAGKIQWRKSRAGRPPTVRALAYRRLVMAHFYLKYGHGSRLIEAALWIAKHENPSLGKRRLQAEARIIRQQIYDTRRRMRLL